MPYPVPIAFENPLVDPKTGKASAYFQRWLSSLFPQITTPSEADDVILRTLGPVVQAGTSDDVSSAAILGQSVRVQQEADSAMLFEIPRAPVNLFKIIPDTGINQGNYPPGAYAGCFYLATDTYVWYRSDGASWIEIIYPSVLRMGGATSSFAALQRSGAILQARLADNSGYTALEALDEAFSAAWDGKVEVPTKNALYDLLRDGTYTPTITPVTNVDATTAFGAQFLRVGNSVVVSGVIDIDATVAGVLTSVGFSLPIASDLSGINLAGTCGPDSSAGLDGVVIADATNNRAQFDFVSGLDTDTSIWFIFMYRVV